MTPYIKLTCKSEEELNIAAKKLGISKEILDLFPNEFEESELGMILREWRSTTIGESFELLGGFAFKSTSYDEDGEYGLVTIKNVQDGIFIEEFRLYF